MATGTQIEVVMPQMGVSVSEGTITKWLKQPGEAIAQDEPLLEISTDKVDTEVPSPGEGVVAEILVAEGETVEVGTLLAVIAPAGAAVAEHSQPVSPEPPVPAAPAPPAPVEPPAAAEPAVTAASGSEPQRPQAPAGDAAGGNGRTFVSPVVARIAAEHGVDPAAVTGTGTGGRVTKKDMLSYIESAAQAPAAEPVAARRARRGSGRARAAAAEPVAAASPLRRSSRRAVQPTPPAPAAAAPAPVAAASPLQAGEVEEPMTAMRRGVMEHMRRSLDTSAHVSSAIEVDMSRIVAARARLKKEYEASYGVNPTYLAFIAHATVETMKDYPWLNGEIRGEKIVTRAWVNLGIAVALEDGKGLIVPVIKNAQDLNLLGTARAIADLATRARTKKLLPDDVQGGTFTITNPGGFGTFHGTPIISQPQVGILGTYAIVKRPWVVQDELGQDVIAIRPMMNITLTYDHRLIDGAYSGGLPARPPATARSLGRERLTARVASGAYLLDAGLLAYREALELQQSLAAAVSQRAIPETVVLLEHPPVVTTGRRTDCGRAAPSGGNRRRRGRDQPWRQVDVPRPRPARLLPDPRPQPSRQGPEALRPRARDGDHRHRRAVRPRGGDDRGPHGRLARATAPEARVDRGPRLAVGDDPRLRAERRSRYRPFHARGSRPAGSKMRGSRR